MVSTSIDDFLENQLKGPHKLKPGIRDIIKTPKTKQPKYNSRIQDWFSSLEIQLGKNK